MSARAMKIALWGLNHRTAPVEVRERLAIASEALPEITRHLLNAPGMQECMVLSTCNRVEFVTLHEEQEPNLLQFLEQHFDVDAQTLKQHMYTYREREAVQHLFRVAASLDSMVIGEPQILGQVKESFAVAKSVGAVHASLDKLLRMALVVAKKVRTETQVGSSSVSIASTAVELARTIFGSLEGKQVLLVGAGKMSELAARHLLQHGTAPLMVANRTFERAVHLAQLYNGHALRFEDLLAHADKADIIITSTGSAEPIFRREHAQKMLQKRRNRPIFFVDIAVPRDVDPAVNKIDGVFVYDIDDLQSVASANMATRGKEAEKAERIVAEEVERFQQSLRTLDVVPAIVGIQKAFENTRQLETRRMQTKLQSLSVEQKATVEALTRGLMNKYLHQTVQAIKTAAKDGDAAMVENICGIFDVDPGVDVLAAIRANASAPAAIKLASQEPPAENELVELVAASESDD